MASGTEKARPKFEPQWRSPEDANAFWFRDILHNPAPITPLNATLLQPAFSRGASRAISQLSMPVSGLRAEAHHGYVYLSPQPVHGNPEEMEQRFAEMQRITMELGATALKDWRETFEPRVLELADRILSFDYDGASLAQVAGFALEIGDMLEEVWDIHMRVNIPPMNAVFGFEEFIGGTLGADAVVRSRDLLQGFDNKSVETGQALWELSRSARSVQGLAEAIAEARVRDGAVLLDGAASEFEERWQAFLDAYGWRSDVFMEFGHPSWREDPSSALVQLKRYLAMDDADDPFAAHERQAAERGQLEAEFAARLPEELRPQFHGMLQLAQQYLPIAEDHNFTIDQKFTMVCRHGLLQLGEKLTAAGALRDADDVFYLHADEIRELAGGSPANGLAGSARDRRRERVHQGTMAPPPVMGTPPPADVPPDPLVTKFFGFGIEQTGDPKVVSGHPCSAGQVTGIARVVLTLDQAGKVGPGDILVCPMTMPAWTPLFGVVGAVVADSGGPLSHCAIVAREYQIPCVAGTAVGTAVIPDGARVRVDGATGTVHILD